MSCIILYIFVVQSSNIFFVIATIKCAQSAYLLGLLNLRHQILWHTTACARHLTRQRYLSYNVTSSSSLSSYFRCRQRDVTRDLAAVAWSRVSGPGHVTPLVVWLATAALEHANHVCRRVDSSISAHALSADRDAHRMIDTNRQADKRADRPLADAGEKGGGPYWLVAFYYQVKILHKMHWFRIKKITKNLRDDSLFHRPYQLPLS